MIFGNFAKKPVCKILSNLSCLLEFVEITGRDASMTQREAKIKQINYLSEDAGLTKAPIGLVFFNNLKL